jgi:hypothetical protein
LHEPLLTGTRSFPALALPTEGDFRLSARIAAAAALFAASFCASRFGVVTAFLGAAATLAATRRTGSVAAGRFACLDRLSRASILLVICLDVPEATAFEEARRPTAAVLGRGVFVPRAGTAFFTLRELARPAARGVETFVLAVDFAAACERAAFAAEVGALDFETLFAARVLIVTARALAFFFALSSADCLATLVFAAPICFACFVLDDFTLFFAEAITSALLFTFPGVETVRILTADMTSTDQRPKEGRNGMLLNDDSPAKIRPDLQHSTAQSGKT